MSDEAYLYRYAKPYTVGKKRVVSILLTEVSLVTEINQSVTALDSGDLAVLTLLDLSVAFDSVDHETLLGRLQQVVWP
jgi:hypothetical protein